MDKEKIIKKFGREYQVNDKTFIMGIHHLLGDHIAQRFNGYNIVLDACCGAGFKTILLAKYVNQVIAIDINPKHLEQVEINTEIAGVRSKIKFIQGDLLEKEILDKIPEIDGAWLDPDWAEIGESKLSHTSKLSSMQPPADELFEKISNKTQNIVLRLPKEIDLPELEYLPSHKLEGVYLDNDFKFYCAYFGELKEKIGDTELRVFTK